MGVWEGMSPGGGAGCLGTLSTGTFPLSSGQAPSLLPRDVVAKRPVSASWELQAQVGSGKQVGASGCSSQGGDGEKADACCPALTACRGPLVRSLLVRPVGVVAGDGCFCSLLLSRPQGGRHVGEAGLQGSAVWPSVVGLCVHAHGSHRPSVRTPVRDDLSEPGGCRGFLYGPVHRACSYLSLPSRSLLLLQIQDPECCPVRRSQPLAQNPLENPVP